MDNTVEAYVYTGKEDVPMEVTSVMVHPSVVIPKFAFRGCTELESWYSARVSRLSGREHSGFAGHWRANEIPSTVVRIDGQAYTCCARPKEVKLCEGLKTIGNEAFAHCVSLKRINIPSTLETIGNRARL